MCSFRVTGTAGRTPAKRFGPGDGEADREPEIDHDFDEALKLIASLPLSKVEKAEAVRRLLAGKRRN